MGLTTAAPAPQTFTTAPQPSRKPVKTGISPKCAGRLYADPGQAVIIEGEAYPQVMFCRAEPGVNGCIDRHDLDSVDRYQIKHGRIPIPLDMQFRAWGHDLQGYVTRTLAMMSGDEEVWHYHTIWERYTTLGSSTIREWDRAGWVDALRRIRDYIGGVNHLIEDAARAKWRDLADLYAQSTAPAELRFAKTFTDSLEKPAKKAEKKE